MIIERDVPISTTDGIILRADIFRPDNNVPVPVIMNLGPYGKGVPWKDGYPSSWEYMISTYPNWLPVSTRSYITWETVDPEIWVPWGYACVRVDSRGAGRSPGKMDLFSPREVQDYYEAIEWGGVQSWSNGKVGLHGISYYAINQWLVAALQPPHLAAMIPWEGAADFYRDFARHGGILCNMFLDPWFQQRILPVQHGNPKGQLDPWLGLSATGPEVSDEDELAANRVDPLSEVVAHTLDDQFYRDRSVDWSRVVVPFLSAANLAGSGLHPRGNFEAFTQAASTQKWLECHPGKHEEWFYLEESTVMAKRFLDHFLKGIDNGRDHEPRVWIHLRRPFSSNFELRKQQQWPLANTKWTLIYLSAQNRSLEWEEPKMSEPASITFKALGNPITFLTGPLEDETELTGPIGATLFVSSSTTDADLFLTLQAFAPDGREVEFRGASELHAPLAQGWLRASQRKLDITYSKVYRPYHPHDESWPLEPGTIYELQVEILPTSIVLPAGYRLGLQISGHDFEREGPAKFSERWDTNGSGPFLHQHPVDRPTDVYGGNTTIHTGGSTTSYLTLPVVGALRNGDIHPRVQMNGSANRR
jgi:uncharacterized protein